MVGILTLHLRLPACTSLKEKRSRLKPLIHRLHRQFNISVAEMDLQDKWQEAVIACALVNSDQAHIQRSLQAVVEWIEKNWPDMDVMDDRLEII
jgi:hypothetical protein